MHIDDLRDSEDMSLNLLGFCGTLISNLLNPALSGRKCKSSELYLGNIVVSLFSWPIFTEKYSRSLIEHDDDGQTVRKTKDAQVDTNLSLRVDKLFLLKCYFLGF